jgi:hypothetical protein
MSEISRVVSALFVQPSGMGGVATVLGGNVVVPGVDGASGVTIAGSGLGTAGGDETLDVPPVSAPVEPTPVPVLAGGEETQAGQEPSGGHEGQLVTGDTVLCAEGVEKVERITPSGVVRVERWSSVCPEPGGTSMDCVSSAALFSVPAFATDVGRRSLPADGIVVVGFRDELWGRLPACSVSVNGSTREPVSTPRRLGAAAREEFFEPVTKGGAPTLHRTLATQSTPTTEQAIVPWVRRRWWRVARDSKSRRLG